MVSYCCVKGCSNNSNYKKKDPSSQISFHAFPSNQELKTKWLRAIGRPTWVPASHSRVCSAHFNIDQINYDGCRIRIKDDAYPINLLPLNSNFEASDVEACRICLATDVKMYSLRDSHLGTCIDSVTGFNQNINIEGLPQFLCYQCAPCVVKWNKLVETSLIAQATLLDIFAKNGKITKSLIKEINRADLDLKTPIDSDLSINDRMKDEEEIVKTDGDIIVKYETESSFYEVQTQEFPADIEDCENKKCETEVNESKLNDINEEIDNDDDDVTITRINTPVEYVFLVDDPNEEPLNAEEEKKHNNQVKHKKKPGKNYDLTPDETEMLQYFDIVKLSLHEQIKEWEKSTVRRPLTSETIYKCGICCKAFANDNSYRVHVMNHDPSLGGSECPVCKLRFKNTTVVAAHVKRAHSKKFFCKSCSKTFTNVGVAKKHQRWHAGYVYKCDACPFGSLHESSLGTHRRRAHARAHACPLCGRACVSRRGLDAHIHTAHKATEDIEITKEYRCDECNIGFASEGARRVHILTSSQHRKKPNLCDATAQDASLRNTCKKCGIEFQTFKELVGHTRGEHPRFTRRWREHTFPTTCQLCGETISSRNKHWQHFRRQHPKEMDSYQPVITAVCDTCGKGFQNSTKLRLHQLRHRNPTVKCQSCSSMFYDKYALARHAWTHSAEKPHQCRTCGKSFKLRSNLERHSRVHTGVTPYECALCGKKFKYSTSVNLHVRTVHYKLPHPQRNKRSKPVKDVNNVDKV